MSLHGEQLALEHLRLKKDFTDLIKYNNSELFYRKKLTPLEIIRSVTDLSEHRCQEIAQHYEKLIKNEI
jgi:hypothetical protein